MACPKCGNLFNGCRSFYKPDVGYVDEWLCGKCGYRWQTLIEEA